jgi:membrane-bound metal-dependent hydrolase YbcI (DUF457 family)
MRYAGKIAVAAYVAFLAVLVFWALDRQVLYGSGTGDWIFLFVVVLLHLLLGFAVVRPWALLLPLLSVVMALPLGYPSANKGEPLPTWLGLLFYVPFGVALVAIGIGLRRLYEGRPA